MTELRRNVILWCGLIIAFMPMLYDFVESLRSVPSQRYVLLSPLLIGLLLLNPAYFGANKERPRLGVGLIVFGMCAQILGVAAESLFIARSGFPFALLGMSFVMRRPHPMVLLLTFGAIPIPDFLIHSTSPNLESALARGAAQVLAPLGVSLDVGGPLLEADHKRFELQASDSGIVTFVLLLEVGWYFALRSGRNIVQSLFQALRWGLLAIAAQPFLILVCVALLPIGRPNLGRLFLTHGVATLLGVAVIAHHVFNPPPRPIGFGESEESA